MKKSTLAAFLAAVTVFSTLTAVSCTSGKTPNENGTTERTIAESDAPAHKSTTVSFTPESYLVDFDFYTRVEGTPITVSFDVPGEWYAPKNPGALSLLRYDTQRALEIEALGIYPLVKITDGYVVDETAHARLNECGKFTITNYVHYIGETDKGYRYVIYERGDLDPDDFSAVAYVQLSDKYAVGIMFWETAQNKELVYNVLNSIDFTESDAPYSELKSVSFMPLRYTYNDDNEYVVSEPPITVSLDIPKGWFEADEAEGPGGPVYLRHNGLLGIDVTALEVLPLIEVTDGYVLDISIHDGRMSLENHNLLMSYDTHIGETDTGYRYLMHEHKSTDSSPYEAVVYVQLSDKYVVEMHFSETAKLKDFVYKALNSVNFSENGN